MKTGLSWMGVLAWLVAAGGAAALVWGIFLRPPRAAPRIVAAPVVPVPVAQAPAPQPEPEPEPLPSPAGPALLRSPFGKSAELVVVPDRQGGFAVAGTFMGRMVFAPGPGEQIHGSSFTTRDTTAFVASFTPDRRLRWVRTHDGAANVPVHLTVTRSGDVIALISLAKKDRAAPLLLRYRADGTLAWQGTFGLGLGGMTALDGEDVLVTLTGVGALEASLPGRDLRFSVPARTTPYGTALFRLGKDGAPAWSKLHEPEGQNAQSVSVAALPEGGTVVAAYLVEGRTIVSWLDRGGSVQRTRVLALGKRSSMQPPKVATSGAGWVVATTAFFGTLTVDPKVLTAADHVLAVALFRPDGALAFAETAGDKASALSLNRILTVDDRGGVDLFGTTYASGGEGTPVHLAYAADGRVRGQSAEAHPLAWEPACCHDLDPEADTELRANRKNVIVRPTGPLTMDTWLAEILPGLKLGESPDAEVRQRLQRIWLTLTPTARARGWRTYARLPTGERAFADVVTRDGVLKRVSVWPETNERPTRDALRRALAPLHLQVVVPHKKAGLPSDFYCGLPGMPKASLTASWAGDRLFAIDLEARTAPCPTDAELE